MASFSSGIGRCARLLDIVQAEATVAGVCRRATALYRICVNVDYERLAKT